MATQKKDRYTDYRYEIKSNTELEEATWLIKQGDFKNIDDYINCMTKAELTWMKQQDAEKKKRTLAKEISPIQAVKKNKAA